MIRDDASRIPAQNEVIRPTGPAPITVMSRISVSSSKFMGWSRKGRVGGHGLPVERIQRPLHGGRDAGEDRGLTRRVRARLRAPQLLHQIEELAGVVRVERNHEFLIVYPERIGGVDYDRPVAPPGPDGAAHD